MVCLNEGGGGSYTVGKGNDISPSGEDTGIDIEHHRVIINNKYFRLNSPLMHIPKH